jgi:hypothetical protein
MTPWRCWLFGHRWRVVLRSFIGPDWLQCERCELIDVDEV